MTNLHVARQPFREHLLELRSRILLSFVVLLSGIIVGYVYHEQLLLLLLKPLHQPLYYTSPAGGLDFILKISLFFGFLVTIPFAVYQLLNFIAPATDGKINKYLPLTVVASTTLLLLGILFAYFISLPATLYFLEKFASTEVNSLITTSEYFTFITRYIGGFGILFQLPLVLLFINAVKKLTSRTLLEFQKWAILSAFVLAAILTPTPDVVNQLMMAVPLIVLYQLSVISVILINRTNT